MSVNNIPRVKQDTGKDGITTIYDLNFCIENDMVQIYSFEVPINHSNEFYANHDIRNGGSVTTKQFKPRKSNKNSFLM